MKTWIGAAIVTTAVTVTLALGGPVATASAAATKANAFLGGSDDAKFARAIGAVAARRWLARDAKSFAEPERQRLIEFLRPAATSSHAEALAALMAPMVTTAGAP